MLDNISKLVMVVHPNPNHPQGKPTRMPGRAPKANEMSKDKFKTDNLNQE